MDDNGLPPLPSAPIPSTPAPVVPESVDNVTLPPLPLPNDNLETKVEEKIIEPTKDDGGEPPKPPVKKKSNMKVVVGMVVALFLVGASIAVSVLFPGFRGDLRQRASYGGGTCPNGEFAPDGDVCNCSPKPSSCDPVTCSTAGSICSEGSQCGNVSASTCQCVLTGPCVGTTVTSPPFDPCADNNCAPGFTCVASGTSFSCVGGSSSSSSSSSSSGSSSGGSSSSSSSSSSSGGGACEGAQNASCCAGKSPGQVTCGGSVGYCTRGTSGCSFDFAKICIPNECYHTGTGDEGRLCASDGLGYVANTTCYANPTVWTCGCDLGDEAGSVGPQTCWNKQTGGSVKKEPFISGCKGSGTPSVTTSVTASVTTGGGSSSGGSSSSSSGGSSSSSSGGTAPLCVETRVYLKKADGTFDTVATPVSQLSSKVSIGNTIRLAIRGNLANFTKGRFIIKKDGTVLETKETTTKNNLPGDPATFEYIYDYTVASGGSYSIEGAVWQ